MDEVVEKVVETELGSKPSEVTEIEEGLINDTFEVVLDEKRYIVQFSGDISDSSSLKHNLKCYELFNETVPVPKTITKEVKYEEGREYIIVDKISGETAEQDINQEKTFEAGKTLAKIHGKASFPHEGWIKFKDDVDSSEKLLETLQLRDFEKGSLKRRKLDNMYNEKVPLLKQHDFGEVADEVEKFLKNNEEVFPENFTAVPVHMDFSPDNILYKNENISGVIDFDYMYAGLRARDLVKSANSFWMHDPGAGWNIREKFYEGYKQIGELSENFKEIEAYLRIETLARLVASTIELDAMTQEEINFYKKEVEKELERSREII